MKLSFLAIALVTMASPSLAENRFGGRTPPAPSAPSPGFLSRQHHIECLNVRGEVVRTFENDPRGPYFNVGSGSPIVFLDKATGKMTRIVCGTMIDQWEQRDGY